MYDAQHFTTTPIRILADWQIFGDVDAIDYTTFLLDAALERGEITAYGVIFADNTGPFGLHYVYFSVLTEFNAEQLNAPKATAKALLDGIVHDTDVEVRWIGRPDALEVPTTEDTEEEPVEEPVVKTTTLSQKEIDEANLSKLVQYISEHRGIPRTDLMDKWLPARLESKDLTRLLEKGKRRGLIVNEGKGRSSLWYTVDQTS